MEIHDGSTGGITTGYQTIEAAVLSEAGKMPLPVYEKFLLRQKMVLSVRPTKICAVWKPFPNISAPNVSVPLTVVLMLMIITVIS